MAKKEKKKTRSHAARLGSNFFKKIEDIKDARLKSGKDKERISTEKVTNLIVKHKKSWNDIEKDIINATQEEVEKHGSE